MEIKEEVKEIIHNYQKTKIMNNYQKTKRSILKNADFKIWYDFVGYLRGYTVLFNFTSEEGCKKDFKKLGIDSENFLFFSIDNTYSAVLGHQGGTAILIPKGIWVKLGLLGISSPDNESIWDFNP